jgi:hypothetical protein
MEDKRMKKALIIVIALALSVGIIGCQKTPENPIVVGKDSQNVIDGAQQNPDRKSIDEMLTQSEGDAQNIPDRMTFSVADKAGTVTVNADAQIILPNARDISVVRVQGRDFSQDDADRILNYFIGDKDFNDRYSGDVTPASKTFSSSQKGNEYVLGGDYIAGYSKDGNNYRYLNINNYPEEHKNRVFFTNTQDGYAQTTGEIAYWRSFETIMKTNVDRLGLNADAVAALPLCTQDEAVHIAEEVLVALGIKDMILSACDEILGGIYAAGGLKELQGLHAYELKFVRAVGGVPVSYTDNLIQGEPSDTDELDKNTGAKLSVLWAYESVSFIINDTGVVVFEWESPYEILETIAESAALLPFSDVQDIFKTMMLVHNATQVEGQRMQYNITRAELSLTRIMEKNSPNTALLVPVWDFYGTVDIEFTGADGIKTSSVWNSGHISHLTINAVDGSIIDRTQGY